MRSNHRISFYSLILVGVALFAMRYVQQKPADILPMKITTWDALGYYMYLPATFIYKDLRELKFYPSIENKYQLQGEAGNFYQFMKTENGYYTGKYFIGVAILQMPFFLISHFLALSLGEGDGFSQIYQAGIGYGAVFWAFLSLIYFRRFLLQYYDDLTVGIGLLLGILGTNIFQYISVDSAQSHAWIFPLYVYILILSDTWHREKTILKSILLGLTVGAATICRPTEAIIFVIPMLWNYQKGNFWRYWWENRILVLWSGLGFIAILSIQLFYWKYSTGQWVFDVGSKWHFLNPHFRVLFGEEKGWLIYTPLCWLMVWGLFLITDKKFSVSVKTFMFLNIWIVIAWAIWRYGGSYSARALSQSTPVMMLPMLAAIQFLIHSKYKILVYAAFTYFLSLNIFQIFQYNNGVLHADRNTWEYYRRIYWKTSATDEDKKYLQSDAEQ